jgi:flagellar basal-body rod protein FlgF
MDVSLYQAAAAMNATAQWQDLIAENLSAASVPGARKQEISFSDVQAGLAAGADKSSYSIPSASRVTNFQEGELRSSGNPLDFALEGPGFFQVQTPEGKTAYTRDGEFRVNAKGMLVTKQGYPVLGENGPLQFDPNNSSAITVSATGDVSQGDQIVGKLQTTEFKNTGQLVRTGTGFFSAEKGAQPSASAATQVRQGFTEAANMSPTTEMTSLITAMRLFESNQKVLQMQSDRMSRVITDLGGTSSS